MAQQPVMQRAGGLTRIPIRDNMYEMAGGGIVAFQAGGDPRARTRPRAPLDPRAKPGSVPPSAVRQAKILMQSRPGLSLTGALKLLGFPVGVATTGYALTEGLMSTDKGGITDILPTAGYDYGAEEMAGGLPSIPTESIGERGETAGFMDYLRAAGLAPKEQVMDPTTGRYVDVPQRPLFQSVTPGLAGVLDGESRPQDQMAGADTVEVPTSAAVAAAAKKLQQATAQQATAQQAAAQQALNTAQKPTPEAPPPAVPQEADFNMSDEMKRLQDMRTQFMGEDPYSAYIKKLEESGKPTTSDKLLRALEFIDKGQRVREGDKTAFGELLASETAAKTAVADRERRIAEAKGREYTAKGEIFKTAYGKGEELAKEKRAEQRKDKETKEKQKFDIDVLERRIAAQKEIAGMRGPTREEYLGRMLKSKDPKDQEAAKQILTGTRSYSYKDAAKSDDDRIKFDIGLITNLQKRYKEAGQPVPTKEELREMLIQQELSRGGGSNYAMDGGGVNTNNPLLQGT